MATGRVAVVKPRDGLAAIAAAELAAAVAGLHDAGAALDKVVGLEMLGLQLFPQTLRWPAVDTAPLCLFR